jgi:hypothetical protein
MVDKYVPMGPSDQYDEYGGEPEPEKEGEPGTREIADKGHTDKPLTENDPEVDQA